VAALQKHQDFAMASGEMSRAEFTAFLRAAFETSNSIVLTVSAVLPKLKTVDTRPRSVFEGKDQLMPRTVKASHAAVVLGPNDEVLEPIVDGLARSENLAHMPSIHTDEMD